MSCGAGVCLPVIMIFRGPADRLIVRNKPASAHRVAIAVAMHAVAHDHDDLLRRAALVRCHSRLLRVFHHHRAIRQLHACRAVGHGQRGAHRTHRPHQQGDEHHVRDGFAELHRVLLSPPSHRMAVTSITPRKNFNCAPGTPAHAGKSDFVFRSQAIYLRKSPRTGYEFPSIQQL